MYVFFINLNLIIGKYILSCIIIKKQNKTTCRYPYLCHVIKVLRCTVMPKHVMSFEVTDASESVKHKP